LTIREKILGAEHPDTADSLNDMGVLFYELGKYELAESIIWRAFTVYKKVLGADNLTTQSTKESLLYLLNGPLSNREPLWKQADFVTASGYAKAITELSGQSNLSLVSLLLGANIANSNNQLERPIEALPNHKSSIEEVAIKLGISLDKQITPILDRTIPMDDELKSLLQEYSKSTLECLVDALMDQLHYPIEEE
jgi:hypothetical protein